jgi:hypothetical protein
VREKLCLEPQFHRRTLRTVSPRDHKAWLASFILSRAHDNGSDNGNDFGRRRLREESDDFPLLWLVYSWGMAGTLGADPQIQALADPNTASDVEKQVVTPNTMPKGIPQSNTHLMRCWGLPGPGFEDPLIMEATMGMILEGGA